MIVDTAMKDPDISLASYCILQDKITLTRTEEVGSTGDMPSRGDSREGHTALEHAVVEKPDNALACYRVLQHQV